MCRIIGVCYGPDGPDVEEWTPSEMAQMMFPAAVGGGPHAWGWMSFNGSDEIEMYKAVGRADTKTAIRSMNVDPTCHWWIGHTRYFTHGSPKVMINNHPVTHGNITGVHNGVIRNYKEILDITGRHNHGTETEPRLSEVDSESIFASVNRYGHKAGLERIKGDMVSVYVDHRFPEIVRFARSVGRELWISKTPTGALVFASQPEFITDTGIECTKPSPLSTYRMITVKQGRITKRVDLTPPIVVPNHNAASRQSGVRVRQSDPMGVRGITDRMQPPSPADHARLLSNDWRRPHHSAETRPSDMFNRPALPPVRKPAPELSMSSPLGRKALQLRKQMIEAAELQGQIPRQTVMIRVPSQAYKVQENGTFNVEHGLYWHDAVMVDLNTYIERTLGAKLKGTA